MNMKNESWLCMMVHNDIKIIIIKIFLHFSEKKDVNTNIYLFFLFFIIIIRNCELKIDNRAIKLKSTILK